MRSVNPPLIVIIGPTSAGKSALAIKLAKTLNGEIVSADSRQVYRGLDLGSGKVTKREMSGVPHWLLNVISPKRSYSVSLYQKAALKAINNIWRRGKVPILCGGSPFYISAVTSGALMPEVPPNHKLRRQLNKRTTHELLTMLKKLDRRRARTIEQSNPRRLIRAIEIAKAMGKVPHTQTKPLQADILWLGLTQPKPVLKKLIHARLLKRLKQGLVAEVSRLHEQGVSWQRLESFGLECRFVSRYLRGQITKGQMITELESATLDFARRQLVWLKKIPDVHWLTKSEIALLLAKRFLRKYKP